jgi:SHAQKYF class myb-like DNA-binding protein
MDLPVIMMSGNGETSAVMKGITHGACDYLLKPVRIEELRNIWQHVVRKKRQDIKVVCQTKSVEEGVACDRQKRAAPGEAEYTSSANDTTDNNWKGKKRKGEFKEENEEDIDQENDDPSTMKKPRVVWSVELHQQFVSAVNQLGIDKAVPKRILELMGVHGLTRENVASHLQKYRLYLKRLSGVTSQQSGMNAHFGGQDPFSMMSPDMGVNIANGQLTPQALARFHMLGRMNSPNGMGFSGGLDPVLNTMFLQDLPQPPHLNGILKNNGGLLTSLPNGLQHLDQLSEPHHLPGVNDLDDYPSNTKVFPQLNGNLDVSIASLGVANGALGPNSNNDNLLMQMYQRTTPPGGGSSSSLPQPRALTTTHLLSNDINFAPVGPLPSLAGNLTPAVGLAAITGSGGGRDLSPTVGVTGTSLSSPLGTLVRRPLMVEEPSNLVNSTSGTFSMAPSVQSPKSGGGASVNEGLDQQQPMWALYNPLTQLGHGHSQGLSHDAVPWSGLAENLGLGDIGQSLSAGLTSQFSPHSQDHGIGFAPPSRGSYSRQNVSFPVSSALDGRMVRSSYEP